MYLNHFGISGYYFPIRSKLNLIFLIYRIRSLRAAVEGDEAEEEDEAAEGGERHGVAGHRVGTAVEVESETIV